MNKSLAVDDGIVDHEGEKADEMPIINHISEYLAGELQGFCYSPEVVQKIMESITEAVVEKCAVQKKLPFFYEVFPRESCRGEKCPDVKKCHN